MLELQPYKDEYLKELHELRVDKDTYPSILSLPYESESETHAYFTQNNAQSIIAILDNKVVGFTQIRVDDEPRKRHKAQISIAVNSEYRGNKIGHKLMDEVIKVGKNWFKLKKIELTVLCSNTGAIKLYQKFGFQIEGTLRKDTIVNGSLEDVYFMGLLLEEEL